MEFFDQRLQKIELETRALKLDPEVRADEASLMDTRWFDYHALHPTEATYLYAHHYREHFRIHIETYVDIRTADIRRAFTPDDIFESRDLTAMWRARAMADSLGIPYPFVLRFASKRAYTQLQRGYPRPNQLYSEEFVIDLKAAWEEGCATTLRYSRVEGMRASEHRGTPDQKRHVAWVIAQIKRRPAPHHNLLRRMFREDVLSPKLVGDHFPLDEIERALE